MTESVVLIGYSGHAYVVADIVLRNGGSMVGYCEREEKTDNPYALPYLGPESSERAREIMRRYPFFVAIGDNAIRQRVAEQALQAGARALTTIVHLSASISATAQLADGVLVAAGAVINPLASIGRGVICNSACVVEHECRVGDYAHIAPGAVLTGNVSVGDGAFVGANAVVRPGVRIGAGAIIGAGAVVLHDVPAGTIVVGNPARPLSRA